MSLDVSLTYDGEEHKCICSSCGNTHKTEEEDVVYDRNITHNLNNMAEWAGIYNHLWRPEEIDIRMASQLIEPLKKGLEKLKENPVEAKKHNAPNGWGLYEHLIPFVEDYIEACEKYPDSNVSVSR